MSGWHGAWALAAALGVVACSSSPSSSTATSSDAGVAGEGDAAADASDASMVANDASGGDAGNDASHASDGGGDGQAVSGYPSEKYLNVDDPAVATVIRARIAMCAQKGFDAIEPDIDDSYTDTTGFTITESDELAYLAKLSDYAHSLGLAWGLKNGGDGGDPATFVPGMLPHVDFAVVEEPYFLETIADFEPLFDQAGKAMFVAEYTNDTTSASSFCPQALSDRTNAALFDVALDGKVRDPCQ